MRPGQEADRAAVEGLGEVARPLEPREVAVGRLPRLPQPRGGNGVEEHHAADAAADAISRGDPALRPEGHAPDPALLDLQRRGSEPLAPGVEDHHAAAEAEAEAADAISRGDLALRPEGHAPDIALLDLQRRGSEPLALGVEEHHAAAVDAAAAITRGDLALRPEGHAPDIALRDLQRRGSEPLALGVEEHHAAAAISRGDLALRPEGHAPDIALLDHQRRGSEPLAPGVEEHHAAAAAAAAAISRGDLALRPEGHARDPALLDLPGRGSEPLAQGVEEHHAADAAISRGDLALRPKGHASDILRRHARCSLSVLRDGPHLCSGLVWKERHVMSICLPDARQLSDEGLQALRLRALRGCELGFTEIEVAELLGLSRETVSRWWTAYAEDGVEALPGERTGRPV